MLYLPNGYLIPPFLPKTFGGVILPAGFTILAIGSVIFGQSVMSEGSLERIRNLGRIEWMALYGETAYWAVGFWALFAGRLHFCNYQGRSDNPIRHHKMIGNVMLIACLVVGIIAVSSKNG